ARLNRAGVKTCLITNQSCIGRGIISLEMLNKIHDSLRQNLADSGGYLDHILFAPDAPGEHTPRRKPAPGMVLEALQHFHTAPSDALMIGDADRDLRAALAAGVPRALVRTGKGAKTLGAGLAPDLLPVSVFDDLAAAVDHLLDDEAGNG
ncbi:MAG: D-glycero-alpha-D-manno-heptose-1,7-bisphosphate 7-phosphatase, partial [Alphaproteobacteria bacterium]